MVAFLSVAVSGDNEIAYVYYGRVVVCRDNVDLGKCERKPVEMASVRAPKSASTSLQRARSNWTSSAAARVNTAGI